MTPKGGLAMYHQKSFQVVALPKMIHPVTCPVASPWLYRKNVLFSKKDGQEESGRGENV